MKQPQIKIISEDGTSNTVQVLVDGKPLEEISSIQIHEIKANSDVSATITFERVQLDLNVKTEQKF